MAKQQQNDQKKLKEQKDNLELGKVPEETGRFSYFF